MAEGGISSEQNASHPVSEGEIRPPKNVKVGLLFQKHAIDDQHELLVTEKRLKDFLTRTFSKGQRNIVLIESADATEESKVFTDDSNEGFERYGSFRAGFAHAILKQKLRDLGHSIPDGANFDANIHEAVASIEDSVFKDISPSSSGMTYTWLKYKILDELNQEGYQITRVYEKGFRFQETDEHFFNKKNMTFDQYREAVNNLAVAQAVRDKQLSSQIVSLVDEAERLPNNTNIAGIFGTFHQFVRDHLPEHIQAITDDSGSERLQDDDPQVNLLSLLQGGTPIEEISEKLWRQAYRVYRSDGETERRWWRFGF